MPGSRSSAARSSRASTAGPSPWVFILVKIGMTWSPACLASSLRTAGGTVRWRMAQSARCFGRSVGERAGNRRLSGIHPGLAPGEQYLLERKLFRRKSTGDVGNPSWLQFSFPTRWHYDVLRALFRSIGDPPDSRIGEGIHLLRSKQQPDGTWLLRTHMPARFILSSRGVTTSLADGTRSGLSVSSTRTISPLPEPCTRRSS